MVLVDFRKLKKGQKPPRNAATLEHLESRLNPMRGKRQGEFRIVLACLDCNHERNKREEAALGVEELWERSSRHPTRDNWDNEAAESTPDASIDPGGVVVPLGNQAS